MNLVDIETIRRNERKTPTERVQYLLDMLEEAKKRNLLPKVDRKYQEMELVRLIRQSFSRF
jgi:hypothetical protein